MEFKNDDYLLEILFDYFKDKILYDGIMTNLDNTIFDDITTEKLFYKNLPYKIILFDIKKPDKIEREINKIFKRAVNL